MDLATDLLNALKVLITTSVGLSCAFAWARATQRAVGASG